jgi:hypothetical protein
MWRKQDPPKIIDFRFKYQAAVDSPYWAVLKYYFMEEKDTVKEKLLCAALAYWDASAYWEETGDLSVARYRAAGCVYRLKGQIAYLCQEFKVTPSLSTTILPSVDYSARDCVTFDFRYQVKADSMRGKLIQYLLSPETLFSLPEKVLWSSEAFWSAIASRELEVLSLEQLRTSALYCISRLQQHIEFLETGLALKSRLSGETEIEKWPETVSLTTLALGCPDAVKKRESKSNCARQQEFPSKEQEADHRQKWLFDNPLDEWGETLFN